MPRYGVRFYSVETYSCYIEVDASDEEEAEEKVQHWDIEDESTYTRDYESVDRMEFDIDKI